MKEKHRMKKTENMIRFISGVAVTYIVVEGAVRIAQIAAKAIEIVYAIPDIGEILASVGIREEDDDGQAREEE